MSSKRNNRNNRYGSENRPPKTKRSFRKFKIDDLIDIQDERSTWYEGEIKDVDCDMHGNIERVLVHYFFWDCVYDEWLRPTSNRLSPHLSKIWMPGKLLEEGHRIDVFDTHPKQNRYLAAKVIGVDRHNVFIHYANHGSQWDEWLPRGSGRIAPYGHKSKKKARFPNDYRRIQEIHYSHLYNTSSNRKSYKKNKSGSMDDSSLKRFKQKLETLEDVPLIVKSIRGDGNCLFRAISHQIYGTSDHHQMVRQKCVEYMMIEKRFFKNFIVISDDYVGDNDDNDRHMQYFEDMSQLGTWGGDPEIQACVEIYNRPIHMYYFKDVDNTINIIKRGPDEINVTNSGSSSSGSSSSSSGSTTTRSAGRGRMSHADSEEASTGLGQTLRLHYEGYNHYNSIVKKPPSNNRSRSNNTNNNVVRTSPGKIEDLALANARARRQQYEDTTDESNEGKTDEGGQKKGNNTSNQYKNGTHEDEERLLMLMRGAVKFVPVQIDDQILFIDADSTTTTTTTGGGGLNSSTNFDDELQLALEVSKRDAEKESVKMIGDNFDDDELSRAMKASLDLHRQTSSERNEEKERMEILKAKAESLGYDYNSEEYQLQLAMEESMKMAPENYGKK